MMSTGDKVKKRRLETVVKLNKRLCKESRVTPWRDSWELESVGRGLLSILDHDYNVVEGAIASSTTDNNILKALDIVNLWKARSHALEALPHAVESTAAIAQVLWRDQHQHGNRRNISTSELRLAYSAAIVRCINGFADALQQQRFVAAPISILCGQLGIPSWLVDIRHEASHNELPTLPVLKLAAITLLEYLRNEYWIPTCPQWNLTLSEHESQVDKSNGDKLSSSARERAIILLQDFQNCVYKHIKGNSSQPDDNGNGTIIGPPVKSEVSTVDVRPFDTFFGDRSDGGIDNDDGDDDGDDDDEDPLLGNFWGSSIGTNTNRFAALEPPKKVKPQPKQKQKPKKPKKPPVQKKPVQQQHHIHCGNDFVTTVSPFEGYSILVQFLVWGGIGGLPQGQGALIPVWTEAFPATPEGFQKLQQQYLPLLEVVGKAWPGFCATLLIHLVDCVLSIESMCLEQRSNDTESVRKLFFLAAWIRVMVSQPFVFKVISDVKGNGKTTKGNNKQIPLATFASIQALRYPLNSLCDRLADTETWQPHNTTSQDILQLFIEILGPGRILCHGIEHSDYGPVERPVIGESAKPSDESVKHGPLKKDDKLSLDDIEALLSDDDKSSAVAVCSNVAQPLTKENVGAPSDRRLAWSRCTTWDACSIGTLPGHPV